jgi:hypothetical protein
MCHTQKIEHTCGHPGYSRFWQCQCRDTINAYVERGEILPLLEWKTPEELYLACALDLLTEEPRTEGLCTNCKLMAALAH